MKLKKYFTDRFFMVMTIGALVLGSALVAHPVAVSKIAGLAVAQSSTAWNSVKDAAQGDTITDGVLAVSPYLFNGLSFDRQRGTIANGAEVDVTRLGGSTTPADNFANPTDTNTMFSLLAGFDGSTWDRIRVASTDALTTGVLASGDMVFTGSVWQRLRAATADNALATGIPTGGNMLFDGGSQWDRKRGVSATENTAASSQGIALTAQLGTWSITDTDSAGGQATASQAAGGGTVRNVAVAVSGCLSDDTAAVSPIVVNLRDGASGAGTVLRSWVLAVLTDTSACFHESGLNITGSANTAMTIEFAAAAAATSDATVNLSGYATP